MKTLNAAEKIMLMVVLTVLVALLFKGCFIYTPFIYGVVLDADTKLPVANAWISAGRETVRLTGGGHASGYGTLSRPHTRTDKEGKFIIPPRISIRFLPPLLFGGTIKSIGISAETMDDRYGQQTFRNGDLNRLTWKVYAKVTVYISPTSRSDHDYAQYLDSLRYFSYKDNGSDDWEQAYIIKKHEQYLERAVMSSNEARRDYVGVLEGLAFLYEKKGDLIKTLELLEKAHSLKKECGFLYNFNSYEKYIGELRERISKN